MPQYVASSIAKYSEVPLKQAPPLHVQNSEVSVIQGLLVYSVFWVGVAMCTWAVEHVVPRPFYVLCYTIVRKASVISDSANIMPDLCSVGNQFVNYKYPLGINAFPREYHT